MGPKTMKWFAWILVGIGLGLILGFGLLKTPFNDWSWNADTSLLNEYGGFIGGLVGSLFSLAGFFLLYLTLRSQQDDIRHQKKSQAIERFETTFFNLLNVQQNITNDLKVRYSSFNNNTLKKEQRIIVGREFFDVAVKIRRFIDLSLSSDDYLGYYDEEHEQNLENVMYEPIDPSNYETEEEMDSRIEYNKKRRFITIINESYDISKDKWIKGRQTKDRSRIIYVYGIFFSKYNYVLGHYFRHLYHIVKFINQFEKTQLNEAITEKEKAEIGNLCNQYAQFIQAQMSFAELALLHDNALYFSKMGELVEKYNLLENCAAEYLLDGKCYFT